MKIRISAMLLLVLLLFAACTPAAPAVERDDMPAAPGNVSEPSTPEPSDSPQAAEPTTITLAAPCAPNEDETTGMLLIANLIQRFNESQDQITVTLQATGDWRRMDHFDYVLQELEGFAENPADLYYTGEQGFGYYINELYDRNLLQDWYPIMRADTGFHPGSYQNKIWTYSAYQGALYDLCVAFSVEGLYAPREAFGDQILWDYDECLQYNSDFGNYITSDAIQRNTPLLLYLSDWIDTDANTCQFESPSFIEYLTFLKALPTDESAGVATWSADLPQVAYGASGHGIVALGTGWISDGVWWHMRGVPSAFGHGPIARLDHSFALSASTAHADACWTFVKWMLSEEVQRESFVSYFVPMHLAVWEDALARAQLPGSDENSLFAGRRMNFSAQLHGMQPEDYFPGVPAEEADYMRQLVDSVYGIATQYEVDITLPVYQLLDAYLDSDQTAEACAAEVQETVSEVLSHPS